MVKYLIGKPEKTMEKHYNNFIRKIEKVIGNKSTDSLQLNQLGKKLFGNKFLGCYPIDQIPVMKQGQYCILNQDKTGGPGIHWLGCYKNNNHYNIYDSFGRSSDKLLGLKNTIDSKHDAEQKEIEQNCGQRSLSWLLCVQKYGIENALLI